MSDHKRVAAATIVCSLIKKKTGNKIEKKLQRAFHGLVCTCSTLLILINELTENCSADIGFEPPSRFLGDLNVSPKDEPNIFIIKEVVLRAEDMIQSWIDSYQKDTLHKRSVVGFVASMDKTFTEWYAVSGMQKSTHQELMNSIQEAFHKSVIQYKKKNGILPEKIIIYRDGVSDGDLKHVEEVELNDLQQYFKAYPENYNPMVTCIIVQKRINTRIVQYLDKRYSNPSPETVIDNTITRRNFFDFYLVPQQVRQETVNPINYIVLKNGCNLKPENVQKLSYKLCHMYYNWNGTIKVPAPVQYAHKLAYLIGKNVRKIPNEKINNTLFYL